MDVSYIKKCAGKYPEAYNSENVAHMLEQLNTKQGTLDNIIFTLKSVFDLPKTHRSLEATVNVTHNIRETFGIVL